jgi:hypothetical protein
MKIRGMLYKAARKLGDIEAVTSGSPKKILRREKNKLVGRKLWKLWKFPF